MIWRVIMLLLLCALPARGEEVVAGLSQTRVSITTNFAGSKILVFGAVKRDAPSPETGLDVIVTVSGPTGPVMVRRKARRLGIWVNTDAVEIDTAPSFYAVATTAPLSDILSQTEDLRRKISIPRAVRAIGLAEDVPDRASFVDALIRLRLEEGLYQHADGAVELTEETLFRTSIDLPANLMEGAYETRIFLMRDRRVIDAYDTVIGVQKVGLERWIYLLAHNHALAYGLLSLTIAIAAGWGASSLFALMRR